MEILAFSMVIPAEVMVIWLPHFVILQCSVYNLVPKEGFLQSRRYNLLSHFFILLSLGYILLVQFFGPQSSGSIPLTIVPIFL